MYIIAFFFWLKIATINIKLLSLADKLDESRCSCRHVELRFPSCSPLALRCTFSISFFLSLFAVILFSPFFHCILCVAAAPISLCVCLYFLAVAAGIYGLSKLLPKSDIYAVWDNCILLPFMHCKMMFIIMMMMLMKLLAIMMCANARK